MDRSDLKKKTLKIKEKTTFFDPEKKHASLMQLPLPILSLVYILFSLFFSLLQERVFLVPGFKHAGFLTAVTSAVYVTIGAIEMSLENVPLSDGHLKNYFVLAISTFSGMYFTNWSLQYLSYPARIIFKSSKLIPVMLISLVLGKKMQIGRLLNNISLVAGLVFFILGDSKNSSKSSSLFGIFLISIGVFADAFTSNYEEHVFLKKFQTPRAKIICLTNAVTFFYSAAVALFTGELSLAVSHSREHGEVVPLIVASAVVNYFSVSLVLAIIARFGSTEAEVSKTVRKFLSVVLSFLVFAKPLSELHIIGGALFFAAMFLAMMGRKKEKKGN